MILVKAGGGKAWIGKPSAGDLAGFGGEERTIMVHGANVLRDEIAARLGVRSGRSSRRRVFRASIPTGKPWMFFYMAYSGLANKTIVAALQRQGLNAVDFRASTAGSGRRGQKATCWSGKGRRPFSSRTT